MDRSLRSNVWMAVVASVVVAVGCGDVSSFGAGEDYGAGGGDYGGGGSGELGATPGGAQDIAFARELISSGRIPPADSITVEGLLSEHDLPVKGGPCEDLLCIRPAVGVAPSLETGEQETWIHIGMVSGFTARDFVRPPLDAVVVIDKSASMSIDMDETNDAVTDIVAKLRDDDRLAIVTFDDDAHTLLASTSVADIDRAALDRRVRNIEASGGANLLRGLDAAYRIAAEMDSGGDRMTRVIILSCGYPDAGSDSAGSFVDIVKQGAANGVGLTFLGVLLDFDYRLAERLSEERGGNYFYVNDLTYLRSIFEEEFDYIVTPLAYDLRFKLGIDTTRFEIAGLYGIPGGEGETSPGFEVKTAFISKRKGAMVARLRPRVADAGAAVATVGFSYTPESAHGWTTSVDDEVELTTASGTAETAFDGPGVRKSVALVNMAERMRDAIEAADVTILHELRTYLDAEATALDDNALRGEVALIDALIALF